VTAHQSANNAHSAPAAAAPAVGNPELAGSSDGWVTLYRPSLVTALPTRGACSRA